MMVPAQPGQMIQAGGERQRPRVDMIDLQAVGHPAVGDHTHRVAQHQGGPLRGRGLPAEMDHRADIDTVDHHHVDGGVAEHVPHGGQHRKNDEETTTGGGGGY